MPSQLHGQPRPQFTSLTACVRIWMIFSCGVATTLCPLISMMRCPTRMPPLSAMPPRIRLQIWAGKEDQSCAHSPGPGPTIPKPLHLGRLPARARCLGASPSAHSKSRYVPLHPCHWRHVLSCSTQASAPLALLSSPISAHQTLVLLSGLQSQSCSLGQQLLGRSHPTPSTSPSAPTGPENASLCFSNTASEQGAAGTWARATTSLRTCQDSQEESITLKANSKGAAG